jgi:pyrroloquinoline-quinone synthase
MSPLLEDPAVQMFASTARQYHSPWNDVTGCTNFDQAVATVVEIYDCQWHPYLLWMQSQGVDRADFLRSQLPFRYAKIKGQATFCQYLKALGATSEDLLTAISEPVLAFNQLTQTYCLTRSPAAGAAMLGMIEYLYADISARIAKTIHDRVWVMPNSQFHYVPYEAVDYTQAQDLWAIAASSWQVERSRQQVAEGLLLGGRYFWDLYNGLYPEVVTTGGAGGQLW